MGNAAPVRDNNGWEGPKTVRTKAWNYANDLIEDIQGRSVNCVQVLNEKAWVGENSNGLNFVKTYCKFKGAEYLTNVEIKPLVKVQGNVEIKNGGGFSGPQIRRLHFTYSSDADSLPEKERPKTAVFKMLNTNDLPGISMWYSNKFMRRIAKMVLNPMIYKGTSANFKNGIAGVDDMRICAISENDYKQLYHSGIVSFYISEPRFYAGEIASPYAKFAPSAYCSLHQLDDRGYIRRDVGPLQEGGEKINFMNAFLKYSFYKYYNVIIMEDLDGWTTAKGTTIARSTPLGISIGAARFLGKIHAEGYMKFDKPEFNMKGMGHCYTWIIHTGPCTFGFPGIQRQFFANDVNWFVATYSEMCPNLLKPEVQKAIGLLQKSMLRDDILIEIQSTKCDTVNHGDSHAWNLFWKFSDGRDTNKSMPELEYFQWENIEQNASFDENDVPDECMYGDWQGIAPGRCVWEIVYFMYQSNIGYGYAMQTVVIEQYFESLTKGGVDYPGGLDAFKKQYWIQMLSWCVNTLACVLVPILFKPNTDKKELRNGVYKKTLKKLQANLAKEQAGKKVWKNQVEKFKSSACLIQARWFRWATNLLPEIMENHPDLFQEIAPSSLAP